MSRSGSDGHKGHALSITVLVGVLVMALGSVTAVSLYLNRLGRAVSVMATGEPMADYDGRPTKPVIDGASPLDYLVWVTDDDGRLVSVQLVHLAAGREHLGVIGLAADLAAPSETLRESYASDPLAAARAVEDLLGVRIDHLATVDLTGYAHVVDALGGLELPGSTARGSTASSPLEGWLDSSPDTATRDGRVSWLVQASVSRLGMGQAMLNPMQFDRVLSAIERCVQVDADVDPGELESVLVESKVRSDETTVWTLPTSSAGAVRQADPEALLLLRTALAQDDLPSLKGQQPAVASVPEPTR